MTAARRAVAALVASTTVISGAVGATASPRTSSPSCALGGPTPGARTIRLDLPHGSDGVSLRLRPPSQTGRRLVEGAFLLAARTHRLIAFVVAVNGARPERTIVRIGGRSVVDASGGVVAPFGRGEAAIVPDLRKGSYDLVGFGSGAATDWGAELDVDGPHTCAVVGSGRVFSRDASESSSGTTVDTTGVAVVDDAPMSLRTTRPLVVGVMQATHEFAGHARLAYRTPTSHGTVTDDIAPLLSTAGTYHWTASARAAIPVLAVAGAAVSLGQPR
jgi:hypothetical protein